MKPKLLTRLLAAAFFVASTTAGAAGLGKLTVHSALGQPLQAEIDLVSVQKDELSSLAARVASPEAYQQAGIEYNAALPTVKLSIEKRPSGQPYLKVTSTQAVNEPFLDLLVELNSAAGKLSREYTVLMDPPGALRAEPIAPMAAPQGRQVPSEASKPADKPAVNPKPETPRASAVASGDTYGPVKSGDTLSSIARATKPEGVNLDQMLVALFRSNPEAFAGKNMNRLKAGKILRLPDSSALAAIDTSDASKEVRLQASNWNAYRQRLAAEASDAPEGAPKQVASGKITATVEDQVAASASEDVLKLSRADTGGTLKTAVGGGKGAKAAQERLKALEEELTAREKALQEANERVTVLEKSVQDMQRLLDIKSPAGAEMQKQAAAAKPVESATAQEARAETAKPAEAPAASDVKPVDAAKAAEAKAEAKPATPADAKVDGQAAKPKVIAPPAAVDEPGLIDSVLGEPMYLAGGVGALALLGGLVLVNRRRTRDKAEVDFSDAANEQGPSAVAIAQEPKASPVVLATSADEMDPLDEATKYLALGREVQAEEVLKEALRSNSGQPALLLKLLEVYLGRKDKRAFQATAQELFGATGGSGDIWTQAARMGASLDPQNPMYAAGAAVAAADAAAVGTTTADLDFDLDVVAPKGPTATDINLGATSAARQLERTHLMQDEELREMVEQSESTQTASASASLPGGALLTTDLNLDAANDVGSTNVALDVTEDGPTGLDINFDLPPEALGSTPRSGTQSEVKLDLKKPKITPTSSDILDFDLSGISLDLDNTATGIKSSPAASMKDDHWFDVQTKFDLAKAYQEMGDKDSAREILKEVLDEGDSQQQADAKALLSALA